MARNLNPDIPRKYRKRLMREHLGLRAVPKMFWAWPWGHGLLVSCSCGWKGELVRPMPVEFSLSSDDLAILQMQQHVRDVLAEYAGEKPPPAPKPLVFTRRERRI